MTREEAIEYWGGLRKTFSSQLEKEENHFGRMHLQTTIEALDMAISAVRQQEHRCPCDLCNFGPPSSMGGKPCTMCPAMPKQELENKLRALEST